MIYIAQDHMSNVTIEAVETLPACVPGSSIVAIGTDHDQVLAYTKEYALHYAGFESIEIFDQGKRVNLVDVHA